jgi:hypothetical protein
MVASGYIAKTLLSPVCLRPQMGEMQGWKLLPHCANQEQLNSYPILILRLNWHSRGKTLPASRLPNNRPPTPTPRPPSNHPNNNPLRPLA